MMLINSILPNDDVVHLVQLNRHRPCPNYYRQQNRNCYLLVVLLMSMLSLMAMVAEAKTIATSGQMLKHKQSDGRCDLKKADRCTQILYIYGDPNYQMSNTVAEAETFCK